MTRWGAAPSKKAGRRSSGLGPADFWRAVRSLASGGQDRESAWAEVIVEHGPPPCSRLECWMAWMAEEEAAA